jgi:hypothetical protein
MTAEQIRHARDRLTRPDNTVSSIARLLSVSRATIYKYVPEVTTGRRLLPCLPGRRAPFRAEDAALQAATGLQQLLAFRHDCTTVTTPAEQAAATAGLTSAAAELGKAAEPLHELIELTEMTGRSARTGKTDLN